MLFFFWNTLLKIWKCYWLTKQQSPHLKKSFRTFIIINIFGHRRMCQCDSTWIGADSCFANLDTVGYLSHCKEIKTLPEPKLSHWQTSRQTSGPINWTPGVPGWDENGDVVIYLIFFTCTTCSAGLKILSWCEKSRINTKMSIFMHFSETLKQLNLSCFSALFKS